MERIKALEQIAKQLKDELVICNIGFPSRELYHVKDSLRHFYMLGSMGMASSIGLGLAIAQEQKVIVFDGDGSLMMNLGSLITICNQNPNNLVLVVLDNECYGSTGNQCTYASATDLKKVAEGIGFQNTFLYTEFVDKIDFTPVLESQGPAFVHVKVKPGNANVPVIPMDPEEIKERFMNELQEKKINNK